MGSLPTRIDNKISLLSKQCCQGCGGIDLKNNASVTEALDQMAFTERSLMLKVAANERMVWSRTKCPSHKIFFPLSYNFKMNNHG